MMRLPTVLHNMTESIYARLKKLQRIPGVYEKWSDYRCAMTDYILTNTARDSSLAVFGAGCCNDIDLARLVGHFGNITLYDIDEAAMRQALMRCQLHEYPAIHIHALNLTGITVSDYEIFSDLLTGQLQLFGTSIDPELLAASCLSYLHAVYDRIQNHRIQLGKERFDYTVSFGLHSQLNNMFAWIWNAFSQPLGCPDASDGETSVLSYLAAQNAPVISRANDTIMGCTGNTAFFANELENLSTHTSVSGALECIRDIKERCPDCTAAVADWNFSETVTYRMLLQKAEVNSAFSSVPL